MLKIVYLDPQHCGHKIANGIATFFFVLLNIPILLIASIIATACALIAAFFLALAAMIYGIKLGYHYWHTKDQNGVALINQKTEGDNSIVAYRKGSTKYTIEDIPRLQQEIKRVKTKKTLNKILSYLGASLKCSIPLIGPFWFFGKQASQISGCPGCNNPFQIGETYPISPVSALEKHIKIIQWESQEGSGLSSLRQKFLSSHNH